MALAAAQVKTGHDLLSTQVGFAMGDGLGNHQDLTDKSGDAADEIVDITPAEEVVNKVFDE